MAGQERIRPEHGDSEPPDLPDLPVAAGASAQDSQVDDLLDDIDEVLESNAEQFVRGFVQKGGQ